MGAKEINMTMQTFGLTPGRLNRFKGEILAHAVPDEVLGKGGRQVKFPKNSSDTYVARRFLPYGGSASDANSINRFFSQTASGDRGNAVVQAHQTQEGVTPAPDSITPMDIPVVMQQYSCLYGFTDKTYNLYEDDIPAAMTAQVGERVTLVNELIIYGALKACTNVYYGGVGTTIATVSGGLTLGMVRRIVANLQANHGKYVTSVIKPSAMFGTDAVAAGYIVYCHTNLEPDIRDMPGFVPTEKYAAQSMTPMPNEVGKVERFRFITSPDLPALLNGGAVVASTGMQSTAGANIDVYPLLVCAADAWSQIAVRGMDVMDPTFLPPGRKEKSDPHGQRGYIGAMWWKAVMIENSGWMAVSYVGAKVLPT